MEGLIFGILRYPFISAINANIQNPLKYFEALN